MNTFDDTPKFHFFLIAGVILFNQTDPAAALAGQQGEPNLGSAPVNAIVRHDAHTFPVRKLAKAQQNLHHSFISKIPMENRVFLQVYDIVVTNVSNLGYMTEAEFQKQEAEPVGDDAPKVAVPERI